MSLFDTDPFTVPVERPVVLSADARRTARNRALLDAGRHPATGLPLLGGWQTCGGCAHHVVVSSGALRRWHKCDRHRLGMSHSSASDIRVSWPACTSWEAAS